MYLTLFKIARPFLQRFLFNRAAEYAADFLNKRREQRLSPDEEMLVESSGPAVSEYLSTAPGYSSNDAIWFTLSGVLLGSALGVMLSHLSQSQD